MFVLRSDKEFLKGNMVHIYIIKHAIEKTDRNIFCLIVQELSWAPNEGDGPQIQGKQNKVFNMKKLTNKDAGQD